MPPTTVLHRVSARRSAGGPLTESTPPVTQTTALSARADVASAQAPRARFGLRVFDSIEAAAPLWRRLEQTAVFTPYQSFDWVSHWVAAQREPGQLAIIAVLDGEEPVALLPLQIRRSLGLRRAALIGTEVGNSDWLMMTPALAERLDAHGLAWLLKDLAQVAGGIDILALHDQPARWRGLDNPFLTLPHQLGPDHFYLGQRQANDSFDRFDDKRLANLQRRKRKLAELLGPVELRMATTPEEIDRVHVAFLEQRALRFAQQGIANIFAEPHFVRFMRSAAIASLGSAAPACAFHALYAGESIVATSFGTFAAGHYSQYINATAAGEAAKFRLIGILMHELFADWARRGATSIDMGLGDFDYKTDWTVAQTAYDSVIPLSPLGRLAAPLQLGLRAAKRAIKQNPQVFDLYKRLRSRLRGSQA